MTEVALALLVGLALVAVGLAGVLLLTLVPFVTTVGLTERRGYGPIRWGTAAVVGSTLGLALAYVGLRQALGPVVPVLGALVAWAVPVALVALGGAGVPAAGARGRHE